MSKKKPGAGVRVSGGRLRVDAARAIDKLRSYQLADPTGWVLEVVRAGVGLSAAAISVEGNASDVFVAIACEPPADESLPKLFEELVDPSPDPGARPLRLLAIGLNAALGGSTRFADVYVIDSAGSRRVRFTPEVFATSGESAHDVAPAMRSLNVEAAAIPAHAPRPQRGMLVHVRSKVALAVLSRWATGDLPRELSLVNDAATEVTVPISVNGLPVPHDPTILLREPLEEGGYVAIVTPRGDHVRATLEAAELGVVLSREPWDCGLDDDGGPVPLVLRIDRPRLPTNAARSAVRWDEPMLERALTDGRDALKRLIAKLAKTFDEERDPARRSWLRLAGLMLLASDVRGPSYREKLVGHTVAEVLLPLLDVPLLVDATGRPCTPASLRTLPSTNEVHFGTTFASPELGGWLRNVLAAPPGDPTHLLFGELTPASAEDTILRAEGALQRRARWLATPVLEPKVAEVAGGIVRAPLGGGGAVVPTKAVPVGGRKRGKQPVVVPWRLETLEGLRGEVILGAGEAARVIELRLDGRALERVRIASTMPITAVADHPRFVPTPSFDAVSDSAERKDVLAAIDRAVLLASETVARAIAGEAPLEGDVTEWLVDVEAARVDARAHALVREGLVALIAASDGAHALAARLAESPIERAAVWVTSDGTRTSLAALRETFVVGLVSPARRLDAVLPSQRVTLVVTDFERLALIQALPGVRFIDYGRRGPSRLSASSIAAGQLARCAIGISFDRDGYRGFAGWGVSQTEVCLSHVGVSVGVRDSADPQVPTLVRVDDDRLIPNEAWDRFEIDRKGAGQDYSPTRLSTEIARQVVSAWHGPRPATLLGSSDLFGAPIVRSVLREAKHGIVDAKAIPKLRPLPLFPVFGRAALASYDEVASQGGTIPYVLPNAVPPSEVRSIERFALSLERWEAEGIAALFGVRAGVVDTTSLIKEALRRATREERLERIRAGSKVDVSVPGAHPIVAMSGTGIEEGLLGYTPHAREGSIRVLVDRRPFATLTSDAGLPPSITGVVSVDASLLDDRIEALSEVGRGRVRGAALSAARRLLPQVVGARGTSLFDDPAVRSLALGLVDRKKRKGEPGVMIEALLAAKTMTSVAGPLVSIDEAMGDEQLFFTREPVDWVGRLEGEKKEELDRTIVHAPWDETLPAHTLLERLTDGALRDVTVPLRRLVTARRAARGLTPRPPLSRGHERALARTVEELAERSARREMILETLGIGAIALSPKRPSLVAFYEAGVRIFEEELDFVPAFEAAVESPLVSQGMTSLSHSTRKVLTEAVAALLAELLRALADARAFEGAPGWALDAQRDAAILGGKEHLDQLADVPLFETTAGTRASPAALLAQAGRLGTVWWTRDLGSELLPLDPERIVLRLKLDAAAGLSKYVTLFDADEELERDQIARANRDRPAVESIAPRAAEHARVLGALSWVEGGREHTAIPLLPFEAASTGMQLYRERKLLDERSVPGEIPAIVRVDSRALVPNRMWDGAIYDDEVKRIESAVARAIEKQVREKLPAAPAGAALAVDAELMEAVPHPGGRVVRGTLWLGALDPRSGGGVRVIDMGTEWVEAAPEPFLSTAPRRSPAAIPLEGTLILWGVSRETGEGTLDAVGRHVYQRLLSRVAKRVATDKSPDRDLDLAHLVRGASLGFLSKSATKEAMSVLVPFGVTDVGTVGDVAALFDERGDVIAIQPSQIKHAREQRAELGCPVFVLDGSLAAMHLQLALGDRVKSLSEALEEQMAPEVEPDVAVLRSVVIARDVEVEAAPVTTGKKKKKKKAESQRAPSTPPPMQVRAGPISPLAVTLAATLKRLESPLRSVVDPSRAKPMLVIEAGELSLAADDPSLRAIAGTAAGRERASLLIAAYALSAETDRSAALRALHELLR